MRPEMNEVGDALDEVDDALAVVVSQVSGLEVTLRVKNLSISWKKYCPCLLDIRFLWAVEMLIFRLPRQK